MVKAKGLRLLHDSFCSLGDQSDPRVLEKQSPLVIFKKQSSSRQFFYFTYGGMFSRSLRSLRSSRTRDFQFLKNKENVTFSYYSLLMHLGLGLL